MAFLRPLLTGLVLLATKAAADSGMGTAYGGNGDRDGTGAGACGIRGNIGHFENYYAAMNHGQFGGSCGKCIQICGSGGCTVAMVVDECPGCGHGDVDMSSQALRESTGYSWDVKPISWHYVNCGDGSSNRSSKKHGKHSKHKSYKKKCKHGKGHKKCKKSG